MKLEKTKIEEIEALYKFPYNVYKHYFPNGNKKEFDKSFVTFDISKKEFEELLKNKSLNSEYVCWDTVVFDLSKIKTSLKDGLVKENIKNKFRKICM